MLGKKLLRNGDSIYTSLKNVFFFFYLILKSKRSALYSESLLS